MLQAVDVDRLGQVHLKSCSEGTASIPVAGQRSECEGRGGATSSRIADSQPLDEGVTVFGRQCDIANEHGRLEFIDDRHRAGGGFSDADAGAGLFE